MPQLKAIESNKKNVRLEEEVLLMGIDAMI